MSIETIGQHKVARGPVSNQLATSLFGGAKAEVSFCDPPSSVSELQEWTNQVGIVLSWETFVSIFCEVLNNQTIRLIFLKLGTNADCQQIIDQLNALGVETLDTWNMNVGGGQIDGILWCGTKGEGFTPSIDLNGCESVGLIRAALSDVSLPGGSIIFDPCCGKGNTAWAACSLELAFYGIELISERADETVELLQFVESPGWPAWSEAIIYAEVAKEKLRRLHNQMSSLLPLPGFRAWERSYFRPRNRQIGANILAARSVCDIKIIQSQMKAEIRALSDVVLNEWGG